MLQQPTLPTCIFIWSLFFGWKNIYLLCRLARAWACRGWEPQFTAQISVVPGTTLRTMPVGCVLAYGLSWASRSRQWSTGEEYLSVPETCCWVWRHWWSSSRWSADSRDTAGPLVDSMPTRHRSTDHCCAWTSSPTNCHTVHDQSCFSLPIFMH